MAGLYRCGATLVWMLVLPACGSWNPVLGEPLAPVVRSPGSLAANSRLPLAGAQDLLKQSNSRAMDLQYVPPLWDWSTPATLGQATPTPAAQAAPLPPEQPVAQAAPPEGDILDEVSVTGTRRPTTARDSTVNTYTVKKEDFRAQGANTVTDALLLVPGFVGTPSLGGQSNNFSVFLRGVNDQRFLILRDGLSLQSPTTGRSEGTGIAVDDLERIEVVTGGSTLRYGAGAVGGVINLITETPKGPPKLTIEYNYGSYGFNRYLTKYGGGDDTFSYNVTYTGIVAQNNSPYRFTLPNTAQFYGTTVNADSAPPAAYVDNFLIDPSTYPNGENSQGFGGVEGDPANNGPIDLFGFLKPEPGPPITVNGNINASETATDSYTAKLSFKPDALNRLTLRLNQRNSKFDDVSTGFYDLTACFGGTTSAADGNGTLNLDRFLPLRPDGTEVDCPVQTFLPVTPSTILAFPYNFNTTYDGRSSFPTGQPYPFEQSQGNVTFYRARNQTQTEVSLFWDHDLTPTTSINSYVAYFRSAASQFRPTPYLINTNYYGQGAPYFLNESGTTPAPGEIGQFDLDFFGLTPFVRPYSDGNRFQAQTAINSRISAGQTLSLGLDFDEARSSTRFRNGTFIDRAISRSSAFLVNDISFSDQLKANVGLRYTYSTQFGSVATPGVGLRYNLNSLISLRANWSQVYNAPTVNSLFVIGVGQGAAGGGGAAPNPNLIPETGITYDAGVDITPSRNLSVRLTYFTNFLSDRFTSARLINTAFGTDADLFGTRTYNQIINAGNSRTHGTESTVDWQATEQIRLRVSHTYTDGRFFGPEDNLNQLTYPFFYGYQDFNFPFHNLVVAGTYANRGLTATLLGRYDSGKRRFGTAPGPSPLGVPAWATLDFNVEIPITPNFTLTGNVFNITDTQYEYLDGNPAPGTTFRVGGRLEFGGETPESQ
ncbi:MAG: TonB-dependent receptor [Gemmatimonadaceae bacterium]|nr:TonB-dependent receptor [Gloeobacterales cyanobacterium ES-bin-141]